MEYLKRTVVGDFKIEDSILLDDLKENKENAKERYNYYQSLEEKK